MPYRQELGKRKAHRVECHRSGFIVTTPTSPFVECRLHDISETGVCIDVGDLPVPDFFALALTPNGEVMRFCSRVWRRGGIIGARFVRTDQLRNPPKASSG